MSGFTGVTVLFVKLSSELLRFSEAVTHQQRFGGQKMTPYLYQTIAAKHVVVLSDDPFIKASFIQNGQWMGGSSRQCQGLCCIRFIQGNCILQLKLQTEPSNPSSRGVSPEERAWQLPVSAGGYSCACKQMLQ